MEEKTKLLEIKDLKKHFAVKKSGFGKQQTVKAVDGVTLDTLSKYNDKIDSNELAKIAIDNSDGLIAVSQNISQQTLDYAQKSSIKMIKHSGENFAKDYIDFYESL